MARKLTAIEKDLKNGPAYFNSKRYAEKAKDQASNVGIHVRMTKTGLGYKISRKK